MVYLNLFKLMHANFKLKYNQVTWVLEIK